MIGKTGFPQCKHYNYECILQLTGLAALLANVFAKLKLGLNKDTALVAIYLVDQFL